MQSSTKDVTNQSNQTSGHTEGIETFMAIKFAAKNFIKFAIENRGWFVRKMSGLPVGVDIWYDLQTIGITPKLIFDVGAHQGESSIQYASRFKTAKIYAFEPATKNFIALQSNVKHLHQVVCVNFALGAENKSVDLDLATNSQLFSIKRQPGKLSDTEKISVLTLDDFAKSRSINRIDFLKIDTEGYELEVIAGARETLGNTGAIMIETTLDHNDILHTPFSSIHDALTASGFNFFAFYNQQAFGSPPKFGLCDALFIRAK